MPILRDGDTVVWDSLAILEYLAERHPHLWPADRAQRAKARSISAEMHSGFAKLLGAQAVELVEGTRAAETYGDSVVQERHRHRYEVNNAYRPGLVDAGLVVSGTFQEGRLVEIVELADHPWFVASQFHPEFKSRPTRPAPLFREFVGAALSRARQRGTAALVSA